MESLYEQFAFKLRNVDYKHKRYLYDKIDWAGKLVIIKGTRKVGKTTLALQYVKNNYKLDENVLYVSSDNFYFSDNTLKSLVEKFVQNGGKHLFIDEIHKYPEWTDEINYVLNKYDELKIVLIGTAVIDFSFNEFLNKHAKVYELRGLSFREFLLFKMGTNFETFSFNDILESHVIIASKISKEIDPLFYFSAYLKYGYYPFFISHRNEFIDILSEAIANILESDLTYAQKFDFKNIHKIKKLLYGIAQNRGQKPNIKKMSEEINATRGTVLQYIDYLHKANVLNILKEIGAEDSYLAKPETIFLNNTNLFYALGLNNEMNSFVGKTFLQNQLSFANELNFSTKVDLIVNSEYEFVMNNSSSDKQTFFNLDKIFFPTENIEIGVKNNIPLWIFGFMY